MDNRLTPAQKDELIENTLREMPLAPMPRDITAGVMKHIQTEPVPRFRLTWADFGLSLIITLCILAVWIGLQSLPPLVLLQLRIQGILIWQRIIVNANWLIPSISIAIGFGLGIMALINLRQIRRA
ncbi:MAG: hypothetical protein PVJ21_17930 [Anaerolineales bacterium]|jgi:hypothetical protein